ncbi:MAG: stalk domain-containing protein [Syntrophomonas sp.]|nr:stalk domain-containing protein [Syntrophomonas sp.]
MYRFIFRKLLVIIIMTVVIAGLAGIQSYAEAGQSIKLVINGDEILTDTNPIVLNNRTLVPIRVICEHLGMDVQWDGLNRKVIIDSSSPSLTKQPINSSAGDNQEIKGAIPDADIKIFINGAEVPSDTSPVVINNRTMVPIRIIAEYIGMNVDWQGERVAITDKAAIPAAAIINPEPVQSPTPSRGDYEQSISIMGSSVATADQLRTLLKKRNPNAPDLVDYYLNIGKEYGIRGDIAFCQGAKETGWWKYGGLVRPEQNNYCGLGATGQAATGEEDLNGADPKLVSYCIGSHGAFFETPAAGVEAQIQHLYAYASKKPLPAGKKLVDPRFSILDKYGNRGVATDWVDLGGKWAVPGYDRSNYSSFAEAFAAGDTYGHSILRDYYLEAL